MTATGPRTDRRKLAKTAYQLRCAGRTYDDIAQTLGYGSSAAACKAVTRHIQRMPPEDTAMARALAVGNYRIVLASLHNLAATAKAEGKPDAAIRALQAVADVQDRHDRLIGLHVPAATKVDITVTQSPTAVIDRAEADLLALVAQQPGRELLPVIDAEIIDQQPYGAENTVPGHQTPREA